MIIELVEGCEGFNKHKVIVKPKNLIDLGILSIALICCGEIS